MKKYFVLTLLAVALMIPSGVFAQVPGDVAPSNTNTCISLTYNLQQGSRDSRTNGQVSDLQSFLQDNGYLNPDPTGYFGLQTFNAVKAFQKAAGILASGYVGPITRAKINTQSCGGTPITPTPAISGCPAGAVYNSLTGALCSTVLACTPNWSCGWSACTNGTQTEMPVDSNRCGIGADRSGISCPNLSRTCTPSTGTLSAPVLGTDPVSQFVIGGSSDFRIANYKFTSPSSPATIQELHFAVTGTNTVSSISVTSPGVFPPIMAPVVNGTAVISGLNITIPSGNAGGSVLVNATYSNVGSGGVPSGATSQITLNYVKALVGSVVGVSTASVPSNTMTLVASKPAVTISNNNIDNGGSLTAGLVKVANVTVFADAAGPINLNTLPVVTTFTGGATVSGQSYIVKDANGNTISGVTGSFTNFSDNGVGVKENITFSGNGYRIVAGQAMTFGIYATVSGNLGAAGSSALITALNSAYLFVWTDVGGGGGIGALNGTLILNYPTSIIVPPTPVTPYCDQLKTKITNSWQQVCGSTTYDQFADLNKDGKIDFIDFQSFIDHNTNQAWCQTQLSNTTNYCPAPQSSITVTYPNVIGLNFLAGGGQVVMLKWTSQGVKNVYLKLRKGSDTYPGIEGTITNGTIPNTGSYTWTVPSTLPSGSDYSIRVLDSATSALDDSSNFSISASTGNSPTASLVSTPTLTLRYDSARNESSLVTAANVKISAGSKALKVIGGLVYFPFVDSHGAVDNLNSPQISFAPIYSSTPINSVTVSSDQYGRTIYNVPAGTSAIFSATRTANPQQMFAGSYNAQLRMVYYINPNDSSDTMPITVVPDNKSNSVTVVGEKSPYITSITQSVTAGNMMTVNGARLNPVTTVYIDGSVYNFGGHFNSPDGTLFQFTVPSTWSVGSHILEVSNSYGKSNRVGFTVAGNGTTQPTVSVVGTPTLTLTYDSAQRESQLTESGYVKITAGSSPVNLLSGQAWFPLTDSKGLTDNLNNSTVTMTNDSGLAQRVDSYNRPYLVLPANTSATFRVMRTTNPQQMFAGAYTASLKTLYVDDLSQVGISTVLSVPANTSNTRVIAGELSPYITSVTPTVNVGDTLVVLGSRLSNGTDMYLDGLGIEPLGKINSTDGTRLSFTVPNWTTGSHYIEVSNNYGKSNRVGFTVNGSAVTPPTVSLASAPTVTLQYDSVHNESSLVARATVQVSGGSSGTKVPISSPYLTVANGTSGGGDIPLNSQVITSVPTTNLATGQTTNGISYYIIPANTTAQFQITRTMNPQIMFAGQYYAILYYVNTVTDSGNTGTISPTANYTSNSVTIVGEKSPYINSVTQSVNAGSLMTISGVRFNTSTSLLVLIDGVNSGVNSTNNGTTVTFTVPTSLSSGSHFIELQTNYGKSNRVGFTVNGSVSTQATATVVGTPTLSLAYDSAQRESQLIGNFTVSVTAGTQALVLQTNAFFFLASAADGDQNHRSGYSTATTEINNSNGSYTIPAGVTRTFNLVARFSPSIMFAGNYSVSLNSVYTGLAYPNNYLSPANNSTNGITIVGELSPYLNPTQNQMTVSQGATMTLTGVRLSGAIAVLIDAQSAAVSGLTLANSSMSFTLPTTVSAGSHSIQVSNSNGASNILWFNVIGASPSIMVSCSAFPLTASVNQPVIWSANPSGTNGGTFQWIGDVSGTAPQVSTTYTTSGTKNATVRLTSNGVTVGGSCSLTVTPATPVVTPSITVNSPASGAMWKQGETHDIAWTSTGLNNVVVYLEGPTGTEYILSTVPASQGDYSWTVPANGFISGMQFMPANQYKIKAGYGPTMAYSDGYFSIAAATPVATPVNGVCAPTHSNCTVGTSYYPQTGMTLYSWQCLGLNGGTPAQCTEAIPSTPVVATCSSFTYSDWGTCPSSGTQTRTVVTSLPSGCTGGSPVTSQACTPPVMPCLSGSGPLAQGQSYCPVVTTCTSFTYSAWGSCASSGTQTRTVATQLPSGCTGGSPALLQSCTYVAPKISITSMIGPTTVTTGVRSGQYYPNTAGTASGSVYFWVSSWGDGTSDSTQNNTGGLFHTYSSPGIYTATFWAKISTYTASYTETITVVSPGTASTFDLSNLSLASVFNAVVNPSPAPQNVSSCLALGSNLQYRDNDTVSGGAVSQLQSFLQNRGYLSYAPTGYFGSATLSAVQSFQTASAVTATGYVGALTRAKIQAVSCQ